MRSPTAYISGYYGMKNSGDDALLQASIWGANRFLGVNSIKISSPTEVRIDKSTTLQPNLTESQRFRGENRLRQYMSAIGREKVIFGGGSVIHTAQDINIKRHLMKLAKRKSGIACGIGLGPFKTVADEKAAAMFLRECEFVGVRDKESLAIANDIAPNANVDLTFDLAPTLLLQKKHCVIDSPNRKGIAVCLCPKESLIGEPEKESQRIKRIAQLLIDIYASTQEEITLLDFNGHATFGDEQVHNELKKYLSGKVPVTHIHYQPNPFKVMGILGKFKLVISMRLHGSILSYMKGTPVFSFNYHQKCREWCKQIGAPKNAYAELDDFCLDTIRDYCIEGIISGFDEPSLGIKDAINESLKNWRISHG